MAVWRHFVLVAGISTLLAGCGGASGPTSVSRGEPGSPTTSGNTATDGFNWFNFRRQQIGLPPITRNAKIDAAAQAHCEYLKANNVIAHEETIGKAGYTGADDFARIIAAGYPFDINLGYMHGEVISATNHSVGENAAEDLIGAIFHRFVIFEPMFKEGGAGAATSSRGTTYFTVDFLLSGNSNSIPNDSFVVYPFDGQENVPVSVSSNEEEPDPVDGQDIVGYPVSIHGNKSNALVVKLNVTNFSIKEKGAALSVSSKILTHADNPDHTPESAMALIPLTVLKPGTIYEASFKGSVTIGDQDKPIEKTWSFTTRR